MLILDRYLVKEALLSVLGVGTVLMLIFISGQLIALYSKVASGALPLKSVMIMLGLDSISNLVVVLPLSFYIGILLAFSRLYKDSEFIVLAACGIGQQRILRSLTTLSIGFAGVVALLALYLAPWAETQGELIIKQAKESSELEGLSAGRFKELTHGEGVVYIQEFNEKTGAMGNVFLQQEVAHRSSVISASSGLRVMREQTGDQYFVMLNGYRYDNQIKTNRSAIIRFEKHGVRIEDESANRGIEFRHRAIPTWELMKRGEVKDIAEIQRRVSSALLSLVLAILALPLSRTSPRHGRYAKLAMALLMFMIYTNMINVSVAWINKEQISPWLGVWWVHATFFAGGLLMYSNWRALRHGLRRWWHRVRH